MKLKPFLCTLLAVVFNCAAVWCAAASPSPKAARAVAFVNVNVVPMDGERILEGQTVVVRGGVIVAIGPSSKVKPPAGATRVDGRGKYLLPGLVDMHVHLNSPHELPLYLANGVTSVYNLNGRPAMLAWRQRIIGGELSGPSIYTCGPIIRSATDPEAARRIVAEQSDQGYDSIKVYNWVSKDAYAAIADEASKRGLLLVGHIPREPGLEGVLKTGQAVAHAEEYVYTFFDNNVEAGSEAKIPQAVSLTRGANSSIILTLVAFNSIIQQAEDLPSLLARPEIKYLAPWVRAQWEPGKNLYQKRFNTREGVEYLKKSLSLQKQLAAALHEAGVKVFVGTDAMNMGVVPGYSVHEELRNLVAIGFSPFEAIRAATRHPAEFLSKTGEFGAVAVGKRADLLLVAGNPLEDINRLSRPSGVMARGRWLPGADLKKMLAGVASDYAKEERHVRDALSRSPDAAVAYLNDHDPMGNLLNASAGLVADNIAARGVGGFLKTYAAARKNRWSPFAQGTFVYQVGQQLLRRGRAKDAIEVLKLNVEALPKLADVYYELAEAYLADGQKESARKYCRLALEIDPKHSRSIEMLKKLD